MHSMGNSDSPADGGLLSVAVVQAIAAHEGVDPTELDRLLYDVINPEALDALFRSRDAATGHVQFRYKGYEVRVTAAGDVSILDSPE